MKFEWLNNASKLAKALEPFNRTKDQHVISELLTELRARTKHEPEHLLISYGTLRPGEANYSVVSDVKGDWIEGTIYGEMEQCGIYPRLIVDSEKHESIPVRVLDSVLLPQHWKRIDEFEGPNYQRILFPFETDAGILVGYVYARPLT